MAKRISANEFIKLAKDKFGNKFKYDLKDYSRIKSKIKVFCNNKDHFGNPHGWFSTSGEVHLRGDGGCKNCQYQKGYLIRDLNDFKFFARRIHGYKYDYSYIHTYTYTGKQLPMQLCVVLEMTYGVQRLRKSWKMTTRMWKCTVIMIKI